jgi:hypothetical protein
MCARTDTKEASMNRGFTLALMVGAMACGKHPGTYQAAATATEVDTSQATELAQKADELWEARVDEAKLTAALAAYEELHTLDPANRHALVQLTRGWYFFGDAFSPDEDTQIDRWGTAITWGTKCIAGNEKIADAIADNIKEKDAVQHATKADAPCLYWTSTALGKWAKAQSLSKTLKFLPTVKAYMTKTEELDPTYYHYGPARYWGAYYAALPSFAGRDLDKSAEYFAASIQAAPYYLPTRVLRAQYLAVATQDVALFDADLKYVLDANADSKPAAGITPENVKDQGKAQKLLDTRHELFDSKAIEEANP